MTDKSVSCPLCNSVHVKYMHSLFNDDTLAWDTGVSVFKCRNCRAVFSRLGETKEVNYDQDYYIYSAKRMAADKAFAEHCSSWLSSIHMLQSNSLLDIGCGRGYFCESAFKHGAVVTGLDPSRAAAEYLKNIPEITVVTGFFENLPPKNRYDIITMWDVVEHFEKPVEMLGKVHDLLAEEGILALSVPNYSSIFSRIAGPFWKGFNRFHITHFTLTTIQTSLLKAGFCIKKIETFDNSALSREGVFRFGITDRLKSILTVIPPFKKALQNHRQSIDGSTPLITGHNDYIPQSQKSQLSELVSAVISRNLLGDQIRIIAGKRKP